MLFWLVCKPHKTVVHILDTILQSCINWSFSYWEAVEQAKSTIGTTLYYNFINIARQRVGEQLSTNIFNIEQCYCPIGVMFNGNLANYKLHLSFSSVLVSTDS